MYALTSGVMALVADGTITCAESDYHVVPSRLVTIPWPGGLGHGKAAGGTMDGSHLEQLTRGSALRGWVITIHPRTCSIGDYSILSLRRQ
jgi:hypothetical protein